MALQGAAGCQSLPSAASRLQACSAPGWVNPPPSGLPRRLQRNPSPLLQRSQKPRSAVDGTPGALAKGRLLESSPSIVELEKALVDAAEPSSGALQNGLAASTAGSQEDRQEEATKQLLLGPERTGSGAEGAVVGWVPGSETESEPSGVSRESGARVPPMSSLPGLASTDSSNLSSAEKTSFPVNGAQASGQGSADARLKPPNGSSPGRTGSPSSSSSRSWSKSSRKSFGKDSTSQRYSSQGVGGGLAAGIGGSIGVSPGMRGERGDGRGKRESAKILMEEIDERTGVEEKRHMEQLDPFEDDSDAEDSDTDRGDGPGERATWPRLCEWLCGHRLCSRRQLERLRFCE